MLRWWKDRPREFWPAVSWFIAWAVYKLAENWAMNWVLEQRTGPGWTALRPAIVYFPLVTWIIAGGGLIWLTMRMRQTAPPAQPRPRTLPVSVEDPRTEDFRVLFRSDGARAFNEAHEVLGSVVQQLMGTDNVHQAVGILIQRFVMEADRAAWSRPGTALDGDGPAAAADREPEALQHIFGDFYEKYQWMTTWIHHGRALLPSVNRKLEQEYRKWRQNDKVFLDRLRQLVARTGFEQNLPLLVTEILEAAAAKAGA